MLKFAFESIPDFRKAKIPISSVDSWVKIGVIWNSDDKKGGDNSDRILRDIPKMFSSSGAERVIEKRAVIKVLLLSTWLQRLYFIKRSFLMASISSLITIGFVSYFGTIGVTLAIIIGMMVFVISLVITRLFDAQIIKVTKSIVMHLGSHRTIRDFIMNHF